jgi:hypothetical protein
MLRVAVAVGQIGALGPAWPDGQPPVAGRCLRRGDFPNPDALERAIRAFIDTYNRLHARPFTWTYTGDPLAAHGLAGHELAPAGTRPGPPDGGAEATAWRHGVRLCHAGLPIRR